MGTVKEKPEEAPGVGGGRDHFGHGGFEMLG